MDRGEPTLIPQWLKSTGNGAGSGGNGRDRFTLKHAKAASSTNNGVAASDRIGAINFNHKASSHLQSYRSFSQSNQNGVLEDSLELRTKEKLNVRVPRNGHRFDDYDGGSRGKFQKDKLQHSQSMNGWSDENSNVSDYLSKGRYNFDSSGKVLLSRVSDTNKSSKPTIEQDFPSLLSEDLRVSSDAGRVVSPGFQRQASAFSEGWTSALAEAPSINGNGSLSGLGYAQITSGVSAPLRQNTAPTNMAAAVAQTPLRDNTPTELSVETQRLEELAVKMSKQLIPMTPTMPRSHTASSLERSKTRAVQQQAKLSPSRGGGQTVRVTSPRLDTAKFSYPSKLQILKPLKDLNGVSVPGKESSCSPNGASLPSSPLSVASSVCGSPGRNTFSQQNIAGFERKPTVLQASVEKRPSVQAQSRSDFFKLLKQKSFTGITPSSNDGHSLSTALERSDISGNDSVTSDGKQEVFPDASDSGTVHENGGGVSVSGGDICELTQPQTLYGEVRSVYSVEEEAAFLRSLGWEESAGEEEGLTEEEISSFFQECSKLGLSPKSLSARKMELELIANQKSFAGLSCGQSLSSTNSEC
ncbi:hypothetical protein MLD38_032456 [Melastoma candidum]|uniref:Uncharacterized protein n=1 Tax=Melastoma candidum TaxID=119954 RepID=A0ACB9M639_9MYRT|nr:hypothetical protein MLD38_032456 [Melastoma candidum]